MVEVAAASRGRGAAHAVTSGTEGRPGAGGGRKGELLGLRKGTRGQARLGPRRGRRECLQKSVVYAACATACGELPKTAAAHVHAYVCVCVRARAQKLPNTASHSLSSSGVSLNGRAAAFFSFSISSFSRLALSASCGPERGGDDLRGCYVCACLCVCLFGEVNAAALQ